MVRIQAPAMLASYLLATIGRATPVIPSEKRQGIGLTIYNLIFSNLLKYALQDTPPICINDFTGTDQVYVNIGTDNNGHYYLACWKNASDTMPWTQTEVDVANCLTNLHYEQADMCISVAGSACDIDGYVEKGGRQQNMHTLIAAGGTDPASQLSEQEKVTIQAAIQSLQGELVTGTGGSGPVFYAVTDASASKAADYAPQLSVNWIGEDDC